MQDYESALAATQRVIALNLDPVKWKEMVMVGRGASGDEDEFIVRTALEFLQGKGGSIARINVEKTIKKIKTTDPGLMKKISQMIRTKVLHIPAEGVALFDTSGVAEERVVAHRLRLPPPAP